MNAVTAPVTRDLQDRDRRHFLHPFTDYRQLAEKGSRIITRADGCYLWDSEGHQILDGMSGLWCVNVGYGRDELADVAARQMRELPYYNAFFQTAHPPAIALAEKLAEVTPDHIQQVFFAGSGSEANDTVFRMVRRYWQIMGQPGRDIIISRKNAYHGSTVAASALGGMGPMHEQGGMMPGVEHIEQPYHFGIDPDSDPAEFGRRAAGWLEDRIREVGAERVAAFIGEPVQGAGGVIIPPETYWPEIQRICDDHGILLVADEVITGFGRTGNWFGADTFNIRADLMPVAKGLSSGYLPIGGVLVGDRVSQVLTGGGGEFYHGFTYSGHPAACAVALANLEIIENEGLVERVAEIGVYYAQQWASLADHPLVAEARSLGLLGAIELVDGISADASERVKFPKEGTVGTRCRDHCFDNGLVMRGVRDSMVTAPPFIISREQIDELVEKAWRSLDATAEDLKAKRVFEN